MKKLYSFPFSRSYWKQAGSELRNLRKLTLCALLIALQIVISSLYIPVSENLRIYGSFFVTALCSSIVGPIMALAAGFIQDNLSFLIHPSGTYFFGYTLSAMAGAWIYALFLYRSKITLVRLALCKLLVNLLVNVLLGSLWSTILFSKGFWFYVSASLFKNLILLPLEILILYLVFQAIVPFLYRRKMIAADRVTLF